MTATLPPLVAGLFDKALSTELIGLRRAIHEHPELAFQERETAARLTASLERLGITEITRVGETGVVARIAGRDRTAPVVAVRGDIDALPIVEATGLPFASVNPGAMHACGHDVHATWAVGAAALLAANPAAGDVLVVFQPAEETGLGALAILESGALDGYAPSSVDMWTAALKSARSSPMKGRSLRRRTPLRSS